MAAEHYATVVEYTLIAAGIGLLLMATFAPRARKPLAVVFVVWLGLNAYVLGRLPGATIFFSQRIFGPPSPTDKQLLCATPFHDAPPRRPFADRLSARDEHVGHERDQSLAPTPSVVSR